MISGLLKKVFGSRNDRLIRQYSQVVRQINALEASVSGLTDAELAARTAAFRERLAQALLRRAREEGYAAVSLAVDKTNTREIELYARHGFERVGESDDTLTMRARLTT